MNKEVRLGRILTEKGDKEPAGNYASFDLLSRPFVGLVLPKAFSHIQKRQWFINGWGRPC